MDPFEIYRTMVNGVFGSTDMAFTMLGYDSKAMLRDCNNDTERYTVLCSMLKDMKPFLEKDQSGLIDKIIKRIKVEYIGK